MRKFALVLSAFAVLLFGAFARAQQTDVGVGASILESTKNNTATVGFLPPAEKGGLYPSISIVRIRPSRYGYGGEIAYSYNRQVYNGFQQYRPIIYDINGIFAPHLFHKADAVIMGGVGGQTVLFYDQFGFCSFSSGCAVHVNSTKFLFHAGIGFRYALWKSLFLRPEAHYYRIVNNTNTFHSDNVLRLGASLGFTFGRK